MLLWQDPFDNSALALKGYPVQIFVIIIIIIIIIGQALGDHTSCDHPPLFRPPFSLLTELQCNVPWHKVCQLQDMCYNKA